MAYLLDTDIASYFLRGLHGLRARVREVGEDQIHLSDVTQAELLVLAWRATSSRVTHGSVAGLARACAVRPVGRAAWDLFPELKARLLSRGRPPGPQGNFDVLQACVALADGLTLVTHNLRHYTPITEITSLHVEDWTVPVVPGP